MNRLHKLIDDWRTWSETSEQAEDGWESFYPRWDHLIASTHKAMLSRKASGKWREDIEFVWEISEETEEMVDFSRENFRQCREMLMLLACSQKQKVRWQVFEALGCGDELCINILVYALDDPDSYCRRRAAISLANIDPRQISTIIDKLIADDDPRNRLLCYQLAKEHSHPKLAGIIDVLKTDPISYVNQEVGGLDVALPAALHVTDNVLLNTSIMNRLHIKPKLYRHTCEFPACDLQISCPRTEQEVTTIAIDGNRCGSDKSLFQEISGKLQFPDYFGHNWDAFHECMEDFGEWWVDQNIVIHIHSSHMLFHENSQVDRIKHFGILLSILSDADLGLDRDGRGGVPIEEMETLRDIHIVFHVSPQSADEFGHMVAQTGHDLPVVHSLVVA